MSFLRSDCAGGQHGETAQCDLLPGTEILRDASDDAPKQGPVLVPRPSNDPSDPLTWSKTWKYLVVGTQFLYLFVSVESALSMGPMSPFFSEEFGLDDTQLSLLTGTCVLALGFANFIIVPCSNIFGRRVTSLALCLLGAATCIWQALATSYSSLLAARAINGIATATSETILVQVVSDVFFLHDRGLWTGVYFMGYFLGLFIGPIIAGNIAQRFGWRSFFWLSLAMTGVNLVMLAVFFPETKYSRPTNDPSASSSSSSHEVVSSNDPKSDSIQLEHIDPDDRNLTTVVGKGRPTKSQFRLWQSPDPNWKRFLVRDTFSSITVFFFPIILWAGLNVAGPANVLLYWNLTESAILSAPPNNFSPSAVGYSNFAFVVGGTLGLLTAGPFSDWIAMRATAANNGIREAEMRLPALVPYFITSVVGIVVGGVGYAREWDWPVLVVVGYGFTGLCVTAVPTIAVAYAVDCYRAISGEIMVVATVIKNSCGFAMSYWVFPLAARRGWLTPAMVQLALTAGPMVLGLPVYFFGKVLRARTRNARVHSYGE
ncbi:major facilitator superfamily domain-containing protein [Aspergillus keveii]|uniref:Major facilitator superfamily domain-containing protein n=1 Tax=Aspergillus keveii TaxID=714993 RepID=A0ABR4GNL0_9EURO